MEELISENEEIEEKKKVALLEIEEKKKVALLEIEGDIYKNIGKYEELTKIFSSLILNDVYVGELSDLYKKILNSIGKGFCGIDDIQKMIYEKNKEDDKKYKFLLELKKKLLIGSKSITDIDSFIEDSTGKDLFIGKIEIKNTDNSYMKMKNIFEELKKHINLVEKENLKDTNISIVLYKRD